MSLSNRSRPLVPALLSAATLLALPASPLLAQTAPANNPFVSPNDVTWTSLGTNENDSMPLGNGDLAANVWTEPNGDLLLLLAKSDAWTETGKLVKLGRLRLKLSPNPFANAPDFKQRLNLQTATIELSAGQNTLRIWADANHPALHIDGRFAQPTSIEANEESWRKTEPWTDSAVPPPDPQVASGEKSPHAAPDLLFPASANRIAWCHFNSESYYPYLLKQEHLQSILAKHPDPLLHRCFGAALLGDNLISRGNQSLHSANPSTHLHLQLIALSQKNCDSPKAWRAAMDSLVTSLHVLDPAAARTAHDTWWRDFWNRSWIHLAGSEDATRVSQGYLMQRYMIASSSRGELPPKFNGGLFTVGHDLTGNPRQTHQNHDPDYRAWGDSYWNQNERLLYWPLIATGDTDLMQPWFNMYLNALPVAEDRCHVYYHHPGALFPETMWFWGLPNLNDFGRDNPSYEIKSRWQRYHIQGSLEVIAQMLDVYDATGNTAFAKQSILPFAEQIITFYDLHYPRNSANQLTLVPAQSLETYQLVAVNPTPDLAGLKSILPRLIDLPHDLTTDAQRAAWSRLLKELPPIPVGKTFKGKVPPFAHGDPGGRPTILPAEQYGKTGNSENPELYVAFPYRLFGVGKPDLQLARDTFAARRSPQNTCWGQDGTESATLGLTDVAKKAATAEFTNYGDQRFQWFWKPAHDWIPDLDNGGDGMITLQLMLMQCDAPPSRRIQLLPAWPKDWTADFKLHAPFNTTIEAHVENGKISNLRVTPEDRAKDVVVLPPEPDQPAK